jgi:hypothetical protein
MRRKIVVLAILLLLIMVGGIMLMSTTAEANINILDLSTKSELGHWVNYIHGSFESYPTNKWISFYYHSTPIPVIPGQVLSRMHGEDGTAFFDKDMAFVSGFTTAIITVPTNAKFVIANVTDSHLDEQLILVSDVPKDVLPNAPVVEPTPDTIKYQLNLPLTIYGVVGKEINVYLDNLMIDDANKYDFNIECAIGIQQTERWTATPTAPINTNLSIDVYKKYGDVTDILTRTVSTLKIAPVSAGNGLNKKYLQIGDSTTAQMMDFGYVVGNFTNDAMSLTQIGTQGMGINKHEGYPGKDTNFIFSDPGSPFVFNRIFDFSKYMSVNGFDGVDFVTLSFGINDMYGMNSDAKAKEKILASMQQYESIITNIHAYNPNIKIGILLTIPPAKSQDAFGADGPYSQTRFRHKRNIMLWTKQSIAQFSKRETSNIYVVPYASNLDTVNNFAVQTAQINAHNPNTINRQANALHPDYDGCWQMADSIYYWIKNMVH